MPANSTTFFESPVYTNFSLCYPQSPLSQNNEPFVRATSSYPLIVSPWVPRGDYHYQVTTRSLPKKNQPLRATLLQDSNTSCIIWPIATLLFYLRTESLWIKTSYSISFRFFSEPLDSPFCHFQQTSSLHNVHSKCVPDYFIVYTQAHTSAIAPSFWKKGPTVLSISTMTS